MPHLVKRYPIHGVILGEEFWLRAETQSRFTPILSVRSPVITEFAASWSAFIVPIESDFLPCDGISNRNHGRGVDLNTTLPLWHPRHRRTPCMNRHVSLNLDVALGHNILSPGTLQEVELFSHLNVVLGKELRVPSGMHQPEGDE